MKRFTDQELQNMLEKDVTYANNSTLNPEVEAYRVVFHVLEDKPAEGLPMNFAKNVVAHIQNILDRRIAFFWYIIFPIFLAALCLVIYSVAGYFAVEMTSFMDKCFNQLKWPFVFSSLCFYLIQYLDKTLIHGKL